MLKRFTMADMMEFPVEEGKETSCMIPIGETCKVALEVRCSKSVQVNAVNSDGQVIPLEVGQIVRWSGKLEGVTAVEIAATTSFWYVCRKQEGWFEKVDPRPMLVELKMSSEDVLRKMIDERLKAYEVRMNLERPLTEEEKDDLLLDIAHGELEFEETPDEFGLGYEERLREFTRPNPAEPPVPPPEEAAVAPAVTPAPGAGGQPNPAPEGGNSSST